MCLTMLVFLGRSASLSLSAAAVSVPRGHRVWSARPHGLRLRVNSGRSWARGATSDLQLVGLRGLCDGPGCDRIRVALIHWAGWGGLGLWCPIKFGLEDHKSGLALGNVIRRSTVHRYSKDYRGREEPLGYQSDREREREVGW